MNAPVAFFAYKRPELTARALLSLKNNPESKNTHLFIFCDGPKDIESDKDKSLIRKVRDIAKSQLWCGKVTILESQKNKGLHDSIIYGVTKVVGEHGKVIVIEDDLEVSSGFLSYMNQGLDLYESEDRVMHIGAYCHPFVNINAESVEILNALLPDNYFSIIPYWWGWGTWKRAWDKFNPNTSELWQQIKTKKLVNELLFYGSNIDHKYQIYWNLKGDNKTWAIKWFATLLNHDGLALLPGISFVSHWGYDLQSENCTPQLMLQYMQRLIAWRMNLIKLPLAIDPLAKTYWKEFFHKYQPGIIKRSLFAVYWLLPAKLRRLSMRVLHSFSKPRKQVNIPFLQKNT